VARRLGRPYVDNDDGLEAAAGRTAREIQDDDGEEALHALELEVLRGALARTEPAVIGAAASVVDADGDHAPMAEEIVLRLTRLDL
jgi:shikimate kinase